jgi:hypothetical protein
LAVEMKADRTRNRRGEGRAPRVRERLLRIGLTSRHKRVEPFLRWAESPILLETFVDTLAEHAHASYDASIASMISGLLDASGCAVVCSEVDRPPAPVATGTWESRSLSDVLVECGCEWICELEAEAMLATYGRKGIGLRAPRQLSHPCGTAVAYPILERRERLGGLLVTFDSRRSYDPTFFAAGKLLARVLAAEAANARLEALTQKQAERVARLRSDVERMGVLLRRTAPPSD